MCFSFCLIYNITKAPITAGIHRRSNRSRSVDRSSPVSSDWKRHYKKDSRYLFDLYTLTFDEDETVDNIEMLPAGAGHPPEQSLQYVSLAPTTSSGGLESFGPLSLGSSTESAAVAAIPSLEMNLHKILARKIQDSEEVSFRKAKLLTKAYYKLLREQKVDLTVLQSANGHQPPSSDFKRKIHDDRLSWPKLLCTEPGELKRIVVGMSNTVKALNDYLVDLLVERDELLATQDNLLEEISELTDNLL